MNKTKLFLYGLTNSLGVLIYTAAVAWFMFNAKDFFGSAPSFLGPTVFLMTFVISATIVGLLVLGRPIYLYLNNYKSEAIRLLIYTVVLLIILTALVLLIYTMAY